jgi:hypothetical protein
MKGNKSLAGKTLERHEALFVHLQHMLEAIMWDVFLGPLQKVQYGLDSKALSLGLV